MKIIIFIWIQEPISAVWKPADFIQPYLQGFEDDHRGAWGTGGVVIQELFQFILQATEVSRGAESLCAPVLDRAEGLWETGKFLEALQQQPIYGLRWLI